jgi:hypothetical protein
MRATSRELKLKSRKFQMGLAATKSRPFSWAVPTSKPKPPFTLLQGHHSREPELRKRTPAQLIGTGIPLPKYKFSELNFHALLAENAQEVRFELTSVEQKSIGQ